VTLQTEYMLEEYDPCEMTDRLGSLPSNVTDAYINVLERMTPKLRAFACRILGWILHAKRILKMGELRQALAVRVGVVSFDHNCMPDADFVLRICGGLITYDQTNSLVTFSHETVRPFLEEFQLQNLPSHSDICNTCLTYLQLPAFVQPAQPSRNGLEERRREFEFGSYAASLWSGHAVSSSQLRREVEIETSILTTFSNYGRRVSVEQLRGDRFYNRSKTFLQFLILNRLAYIVISPLADDELIADA
jgi:hypothetical protein